MPRDKLVIDIETKNVFDDVGGRDYVEKLDASLIGVYSYNQDKFFHFKEGEFEQLAPLLQNARLIIGFSINRFDLPVMKKYFNFSLTALPRFDILEEIEIKFGKRVGLDILARANLGLAKTGHGLDAVEFYKQGNWQALADYCLQDVKITKELYDLVKARGYLQIPDRYTDQIHKVAIDVREAELPASLF